MCTARANDFPILNFGYVASYVLDAGDSLVAFDAGMGKNTFLARMKSLNLEASTVLNVCFTHFDPDHVGGIGALPNARAHMDKAEVSMLDGTVPRLFGKVFSKPLPSAHETLEDGQEMLIGNAIIRCISTPGHTAGSMSFLINDSILVVGDEKNLKRGKAVLDFKLLSMDNEQRKESIIKLAGLKGIRLLCTAHSGYTDDFRLAMQGWVQCMQESSSAISNQWKDVSAFDARKIHSRNISAVVRLTSDREPALSIWQESSSSSRGSMA